MQPYIKTGEDKSVEAASATEEQSEAVLQSCFSIFQLGVAIALEKFDAPDEAEEADEKEAVAEVEEKPADAE